MHRVTAILQHLWQGVADPWGFVVLEAFDGCDMNNNNGYVHASPFTTAHKTMEPDMTHYGHLFAMAVAYEGPETLMYTYCN